MDMHRTTILLPEDLRASAEAAARRQGISLGELIRRRLKVVAKPSQRGKRSDDPIFRYHARKLPEPDKGGVEDGVAHHDRYIAEALEAEVRRWK